MIAAKLSSRTVLRALESLPASAGETHKYQAPTQRREHVTGANQPSLYHGRLERRYLTTSGWTSPRRPVRASFSRTSRADITSLISWVRGARRSGCATSSRHLGLLSPPHRALGAIDLRWPGPCACPSGPASGLSRLGLGAAVGLRAHTPSASYARGWRTCGANRAVSPKPPTRGQSAERRASRDA